MKNNNIIVLLLVLASCGGNDTATCPCNPGVALDACAVCMPEVDGGVAPDGAVDDAGHLLVDASMPGIDAPTVVVDPLGDWVMSFSYAADSCGAAAMTAPETIKVGDSGSGWYQITLGATVATNTSACTPGSTCMSCDAFHGIPGNCVMTVSFTTVAGNVTTVQDDRLTLSPNNGNNCAAAGAHCPIAGGGTQTVTTKITGQPDKVCMVAFTATGSFN